VAFITDSAQKGPNGIIVVDLGTGESWRRLDDHPSTKPEEIDTFLPLVEGRPFLERLPDGSVKQGAGMGANGIVGKAAAIANAVYHATGVRVRDLPVTLDKLL
jgi:hypothetical protein